MARHPAAETRRVSRSTIPTTWPAPNAMRMPISLVRCEARWGDDAVHYGDAEGQSEGGQQRQQPSSGSLLGQSCFLPSRVRE